MFSIQWLLSAKWVQLQEMMETTYLPWQDSLASQEQTCDAELHKRKIPEDVLLRIKLVQLEMERRTTYSRMTAPTMNKF